MSLEDRDVEDPKGVPSASLSTEQDKSHVHYEHHLGSKPNHPIGPDAKIRKYRSHHGMLRREFYKNKAAGVAHPPRARQVHRTKDEHLKLWATPKEVALAIALAAQKKVHWDIDKYLVLCVLAGLYIGIGSSSAVLFSSLFTNPGLSKLAFAMTFPIALALILMLSGELFTGNTMYFSMGLFQRNISWWSCVFSWVVSFFGNWAGCALYGWLFGIVGEIFEAPAATAMLVHIAEYKLSLDWGVTLLHAIPCNFLVCSGVFFAISAEDIASKLIGMWIPIFCFVVAGYEHCIANMFLVSMGIWLGADYSYGYFIYHNLIPVTIGNFIGGGIFLGVMSFYLYSFTEDPLAFQTAPEPLSFDLTKWSFVKLYKKWRHPELNLWDSH